MEARMARIETMMEALIHDRGMTMTPMGSIERDDTASDVAFALPLLDPINPALAHMEHPADMAYESHDWRPSAEPPLTIRLDHRPLPFPRLAEYRKYMDSFFADIHLRHPCIDQGDFRARGERILAGASLHANNVFFLALNYAIFACCDILLDSAIHVSDSKPTGWHWFQVADDLVDKNALLGGPPNLVLIQLLLFQVSVHPVDWHGFSECR